MTVRAFQPRKIDPPQFVAETREDLIEKEGEFVAGEQCDGCGNHTYEIKVRMLQPGVRQFEAVCSRDPDEDPEFRHPSPCGTAYPISAYDDDEVTY